MTAAESVRALYEAYQARNWVSAGELFHPDVAVEMPATGERLAGHGQVLDFQRSYPEPWGDLVVRRVVGAAGPVAAAEIEVRAPAETFRMAAFWECRDGLLWRGVEYWTSEGGDQPPAGREVFPDVPTA